MKLPSFGHTRLLRGVCAFGVFALVSVGYVGLRPEVEPESMRGKTDIDVELLADPLLEDLARDLSNLFSSNYRASKGLLSCDDECVVNKRRYLIAEKELATISKVRGQARSANRVRDRKEARTPMSFAEELEARQEVVEERLGERKGERMDIVRHVQAHRHQDRRDFLMLSLEERTQVRIDERDAAIVAYRLINPRVSPEDVAAERAARLKERMDENAAFRAVNPRLSPRDVKAKRLGRFQGRMDTNAAYRMVYPKHTARYVEKLHENRAQNREDAAEAHQEEVQEAKTEYLNAIATANGYANWAIMFEWRFMTIAERRDFRREERHPGILERQTEINAFLAAQSLADQGRQPVCRMRKDCYCEGGASDYRGTVSVTRSGKTCQAWHVQEPHAHSWVPVNFPGSGLTVNNCRNPDGAETAWCHTTDDSTKWEFCDVPKCDML